MAKKKTRQKNSQTPHIFVATPMYGGQCTGGYLQSVLNLQIAIQERGWNFSYVSSMNDALIQRARNYLTYLFLASDATHLLFIDADIVFNPQDIIKMVESDQDIVCGMYPKKFVNWDRVAELALQGVPPNNLSVASSSYVFNVLEDFDQGFIEFGDHLIEIRHGGTGYMLIKRRVFEKLKSTTSTYTNDYYLHLINQNFYNFFSIDINGTMLLSEDWYFCESWTKQGGKIYLAAWAIAKHIGSYVFG